MPVAPPLERAAKRQQDGGEDDCNGRCPPGGKATQDAEERGDPNGGRGGQTAHLAVAVAMQNDARPEKADADDDTLNDRLISACGSSATANTASADPMPTSPTVRTPVGLFVQLTIEAKRTANEHRGAEPKHDICPAEHGAASPIEGLYATPPRGLAHPLYPLAPTVPWHPGRRGVRS